MAKIDNLLQEMLLGGKWLRVIVGGEWLRVIVGVEWLRVIVGGKWLKRRGPFMAFYFCIAKSC